MAHVTISDYTPRETFTVGAGGSSGPFTLPSGFVVFTPSSDIKFYDDGVQLSYADPPGSSTQFAFSGTLIDGGYQGGTLLLGGKATSGSVMSAVRDIPIERTTDFSYPSSTLDLEGLNTQLDKLFAIFQDRESDQGRALRQPVSDSVNIDYIPSSTGRAGMLLGFDGDGDPIAASPTTGVIASAYAATFLDDADEATFKATVNLEPGVDVQAYSALLASIAGLTPSSGALLMGASTTGWVLVPKGTTGQVLTVTSTGLAYAVVGSKVIQIRHSAIAAASGTGSIPQDNTTPGSTEGTQIWSQAITPTSTGNKINLRSSASISNSAAGTVALAFFSGSTCIGAFPVDIDGNNEGYPITYETYDTIGSTSSVTYSCRIGTNAGTWYVGQQGTAIFNGEMAKGHYTVAEVETT